jgi:transposase
MAAYPGRKRLPDQQALQGIMDEWQRAGVWERLHELLLATRAMYRRKGLRDGRGPG